MSDKKLCQRLIEPAGADTDALVYELYGLTDEEMTIVQMEDAGQ